MGRGAENGSMILRTCICNTVALAGVPLAAVFRACRSPGTLDYEASEALQARSAALWRRELTAAGENALGTEGSPPERSIYESILAAAGLRRREVNEWGFTHRERKRDPHSPSCEGRWSDSSSVRRSGCGR